MNLKAYWDRWWRKPTIEDYLLTIADLKENAYGVLIRQELSKRIDSTVTYNRLWVDLDRLEQAGLIVSTQEIAAPGRPLGKKRYYLPADTVTAELAIPSEMVQVGK